MLKMRLYNGVIKKTELLIQQRQKNMQIIRWNESTPPQEQELHTRMQHEGLAPYTWSNGAHYYYAAHTHSYEKVLYCVRGSIRFIIHNQRESETEDYLDLNPGDCMILPAGVRHSAQVGPDGVTCLEGARYITRN
jgi:mannose-6-phosphate isomerase-like protein (cupin superfamily)